MKRRRILLTLAVVFIAGIAAVVLWPGEREPEYQGKKLSEWLRQYVKASPGSAQESEAAAAVLKIGTNGIPLYVKWIDCDVPMWKLKFVSQTGKWPLVL